MCLPCLPKPVPIPIKNFKLDDNNHILSYCDVLKHKGGIYCFVNTINNKRYIGSVKDLYARLIEHLAGKKSNVALQKNNHKIWFT